jgi:hypothetical protein
MRVLTTIIFLSFSAFCFGQFSVELDKRNGFKDLKILSDVASYSGLEYWKEDKSQPDHAIYRAKKGNYDKIGDVDVAKVTVYTYRKQIFKIEVITEKNEKLFRSMEKAYGKINSSIAYSYSYWDGEKIRLKYETIGSKKIQLTYVSKEIKKIIALDKRKDVDSLSTEF